MFGWAFESFYANPADYGSTYIITGRFETVTVSNPATMLEVAKRVSQNNTLPITIRQVFPDGSGVWIVAPTPACAGVVKPPGPPVSQPEPEPEEEEGDGDIDKYFEYQPQGSLYEARVWYWLKTECNLSEKTAAQQVAANRAWVEQQENSDEDPWQVAKQLSTLRFGQRFAPRKKRTRRPTWECPMPQTLLVRDVDVIAETKRLIAVVPVLHGMPMPSIYVRRNTTLRQQHGAALLTRHHIRLTDAPELDRFEVVDTLSHELAHLYVYWRHKDTGHSQRWRNTLEYIALHGYSVRIQVKTRHSGELAEALRGGPRRRGGPARECSEQA